MKILIAVFALLIVSIVGLKLAFPLPRHTETTPSQSLPPDWNGPLGRSVSEAIAAHPGLSGVRSLNDGRAAFAARAILARTAVSSIDAQYYIWQDDTTGLMLLDELRAAAERGVRVRLLVDDNGIPGLDTLLAELDALPDAEVRIFNPFTLRTPKLLSYAFDFRRLNRRMHNKSMTVDGVATIVGGRNIGDIYFAYGEGVHYLDVDAIATGPIVAEVSASFDAYWNSASSYPAASVWGDLAFTPGGLETAAGVARVSARGAGYQRAIEENTLARAIEAQNLTLLWGDITLFVDDPAKGLGQASDDQIIVEHLFPLAAATRTSLDLVSAYFIPGQRGADLLEARARDGIRTRVLTNSLEATDVPPVHSAYRKYRKGLVDSGVEVLELRAMRDERPDLSLPEMLAGSASGLHAKVFSFDRERLFIGSYNLDPRSARLNTEMGLLIDIPQMAAEFSELLDDPRFAYRVLPSDGGGLVWVATGEDGQSRNFDTEPNTGLLKRAVVRAMSWLPVEWML